MQKPQFSNFERRAISVMEIYCRQRQCVLRSDRIHWATNQHRSPCPSMREINQNDRKKPKNGRTNYSILCLVRYVQKEITIGFHYHRMSPTECELCIPTIGKPNWTTKPKDRQNKWWWKEIVNNLFSWLFHFEFGRIFVCANVERTWWSMVKSANWDDEKQRQGWVWF